MEKDLTKEFQLLDLYLNELLREFQEQVKVLKFVKNSLKELKRKVEDSEEPVANPGEKPRLETLRGEVLDCLARLEQLDMEA